MGVPKFFRYISERYPCLSETVKEYQIPEFDNLYLDMNGIIHTCSHPDDGDPHFRITEEKIFQDIFHYIEVLFRMIKPRKLFFMAVDGVAPRAKMNQQRGRRFRSAKEAQTLETKARERGEVLPTEARFDSNCITPGTVFMARLHEQLKYFVVNKISTDKLWQNCKIVLSGHETPGEGEHKIMDYIRYMRAQPGYDPNTRHCLYGLDADLIMLGLCTHEPHFSLLREEVKFGKKSNKRKNIPEQITFFLLHLSLMREYLELEFQPLKDSLTFEYDMEKIVDDWVLMGFLVGNDFIPHLPNMHITNGALPILYNAYMKVLPKLGGYINEGGTLNLERFEAFIQELGSIDIDNFSEKYADLKWFEGKTGRHLNEKSKSPGRLRKLEVWKPESDAIPDEPSEPLQTNSDLAALIKATDDILLEPSVSQQSPSEDVEELEEACEPEIESDVSDTEEEDLFTAEFLQHKTDYYMNKLEYENVTPEVLRSQAEEYVRAIQWNLHYYYNGVCSWSWYYPHHYAPYVSDIKGFSDLKLNFQLGTPFKPYEQLLAVLPSASKSLLPEPYQELMVDEDSLIKEYYPEDFKTDLNGKRQEWEAVVLIPFIEEDVLLKAMATCNDKLTSEEKERNRHGPMLVYHCTSDDLGQYEAPQYFPVIKSSRAKCELVSIEDIRIPMEKLVKGAYPGVKFDVYYPGFPTMKHLKYEGSLEKARVKVFEQPSKGDNMVLRIIQEEQSEEEEPPTADAFAKELLGRTVHVGWPHLVEALVVSVSNREYRYHSAGEKGQYNVEENKGNLASLWNAEKQGIVEHYRNRLGVDVGTAEMLVHVKVMVGRKYIFTSRGRISLEKQWANVTSAFPLQTVVRDIAVYEENYVAYKDISSVFPVGSHCFMLGQPGYGIMAEILDSTETLKEGRVKISLKKYEEPDLTPVIEMENDIRVRFMNSHVAATRLAISKGLFSRITGSVYIAPGGRAQMGSEDVPKVNIGLNLKFNKKNEEVPGYSRKEGNTWLYSDKAINLVYSYMQKFPDVFQYLNYNVGNDVFYEEEVFNDGNAKERLREITAWIKQQPFYSVERQVCGSSVLDPEAIQMLERVIDEYNQSSCRVKQMVIKVRPHLLYKPDLQFGNLMPDPAATFHLYDRVVNVREGYTVPLGFKGTIIGIHKPSSAKESETLYDVLFDQPFTGGLALNCSPNRGYRMPRPAIINISYGQRVHEQKTGKPGQFMPSLQGVQSQVGPKNNYANPAFFSANSGSYPPSQFQPQAPVFSNWSHGCNYPVRPPAPPVHNFSQYNYNYHPSFEGPYSRHVYNSNNVNLPSFNNSGPNTFVPYKSNHFPLSPTTPPHYGPPFVQQNVPNVNSQDSSGSGDLRGFQQKVANGGEAASTAQHGKVEGKKEEAKKVILQKVSILKQDAKASHKSNQMEHAQNQFSKIDSEFLKKMLRINENENNPDASNQKKSSPKETTANENSTQLSVEDFFAHARNKKQQPQQKQPQVASQSCYSTARLLSEFQAQNLGCPSYQYFEMNKKFMAKISLPNGTVVVGEPARSRDQAAENAATKALQNLQSSNTERVSTKPPLDAVPEPPRRWQSTSNDRNQLSPQKSWPKSKGKVVTQENWRTEGKQEKRDRPVRVDPGQIHLHLNIDPAIVGATRSAKEKGSSSKPDTQKKQKCMIISNSTFVPLQAVRQHRNRTSSSGTSETLTKENNASKKPSQPEKGEKAEMVQPEENVSAAKVPSKPRRERTVRIAAKFPTAMTQ